MRMQVIRESKVLHVYSRALPLKPGRGSRVIG